MYHLFDKISLISNDGILNIENTEIYNNLNITRYYNWKFNNAGSVITYIIIIIIINIII